MIIVVDFGQCLVGQFGWVGDNVSDLGEFGVRRDCLYPTFAIRNACGNNSVDKGLDMRCWCSILIWWKDIGIGIANGDQPFMNMIENPG
jgi:hypothetical protein